jgi:uncharacterized membrane protein
MAAPSIALTIAYWLHMMATVFWIGSISAMSLVVIPAARSTLDPAGYRAFLSKLQSRVTPIGWFSLAVLATTGMFQMSSHPSYSGFLEISNSWAAAILIKHLVVGLMILTSAYLTWGILPALRRSSLLISAGRPISDIERRRLERREYWLLTANLVLSILVLGLTAWARAAG